MDEEDIRSYREAMMRGPLRPFFGTEKPDSGIDPTRVQRAGQALMARQLGL
jgi:hypothetical protein